MHFLANPARFLRIARWLTLPLLAGGLVMVAAALGWGLLAVPPDRLMGDTVRILFVHVPAAWLGMGGWTAIAVASLVELVWRHPLAALAARASALPGALFTFLCLVSGSIWGRPAWVRAEVLRFVGMAFRRKRGNRRFPRLLCCAH